MNPSIFLERCMMLWSFVAIATSSAVWKLQVDSSQNNHVTVTLTSGQHSRLVIQHTPSSPFILIGRGHVSFTEFEGNFDIRKYTDHKAPLEEARVLESQDGSHVVEFSSQGKNAVRVSLTTDTHAQMKVKFLSFPDKVDQYWIRLHGDKDEKLYGGGEQFTYLNLKGKMFPIWTREQGIGRNKSNPVTFLADALAGGYGGDYHTSYFPQATFMSSRKLYCHFEENNYMEMDFTQADYHEIFSVASLPDFHCNAGDTYESLISQVTLNLGRQPPLPGWLREGVIIGLQGGSSVMLRHVETMEEHGVHVAGLWIQDWPGNIFTSFGKRVFWNWEWNPEHYMGLDVHIKQLLVWKGIRLLAYITPHLNVQGNLYKIGSAAGYMMKTRQGDDYLINFGEFTCGTVDLTNSEACEWYKGIIKTNLIEFGFGGWMADFSEYIPVDAVFHDGRSGQEMHNMFPVLWAKTNREAVEEAGKLGEIMFYMRAGGPGSQKYTTMTWAGDQNVDWGTEDGFPSVVPAALSFGLSGIGMTHFDIGGYTTLIRTGKTDTVSIDVKQVRSKELFMRMAEVAVFTPIMRTHEGNVPNANFQIYQDNAAMNAFAVLVNMFRALGEYTETLMREHVETGLPLQRPLFLHYPDDAVAHDLQYQYLYGRHLLVAPVLKPNVTTWQVYLPRDQWVHLFTGREYEGGSFFDVDAPLGKPPVFYRKLAGEWIKVFSTVANIANGKLSDKAEL